MLKYSYMQPQNPMPAPPPITPNSNPYDFITNPGPAPKKSWLPSGNSTSQRLFIVVAGLLGLVIVFAIVASLLGSAGKGDKEALLSAALQQQELIRVAGIAEQKTRGNTAKDQATTVKMTLQSDQAGLQAIAKKSINLDAEVLATGKNAKTDELLTAAEQTNRLDEYYMEFTKEELTKYQATLKKIHDSTGNAADRETIAAQYEHVGLLLGTPSN